MNLLKVSIALAVSIAVIATACGGEASSVQPETTTTLEDTEVTNSDIEVTPTTSTIPTTTTTTIPLRDRAGLSQETIDMWASHGQEEKLYELWDRYGIGPRDENGLLGCAPAVPNWAKNACFQYTIGPGEPDPPGEIVPWPARVNGEYGFFEVQEGLCPRYRWDPTWVNEALAPYFVNRNIARGHIPLEVATPETLPFAIEWAAYIGILALMEEIFSKNEALYRNPSWESCLNYMSSICCSPKKLEREIGTTVRDIHEDSYTIPTFEPIQGRNIYVYAVSTFGTTASFSCVPGYRNRPESGHFSRQTGLRIRTELDYIQEYAFASATGLVDGRLRGLAGFSLKGENLEGTGTCEGDIEILKPAVDAFMQRHKAKQTGFEQIYPVNRWYYIPVETALKVREIELYDLQDVFACLVEIEPTELYVGVDANFLTCNEIKADERFTEILALEPSSATPPNVN